MNCNAGMNKIVLVLLAVFCALPSVFAREPDLDSAEAWAGTWKNDHGQTMTISFKGLNCVISYSKGTPDTGKMRGDGDTIEFEGSTKGGYEHSQGTLVLSADQLGDGTLGLASYWRSVYAVRAWRSSRR